jgi:uncharacterized linocin/CFP29 family protein
MEAEMTQNNPQVPWTDEQWARVNQAIQEEASRARVAATFLPLHGPLPGDTDFVRKEEIKYKPPLHEPPTAQQRKIWIDDKTTRQLATLQVKVEVRGAQLSDPEMTSVLALFRRAANVLARLEDAVVFNGLKEASSGTGFEPKNGVVVLPPIWEIPSGDDKSDGLCGDQSVPLPVHLTGSHDEDGELLVSIVSASVGKLEENGHFGPFAVVLDQSLFLIAQTPGSKSLVLPQDRIIPFLGGGPLLRSSTLPLGEGVVVALGGAPVELVIARDVSLQFLLVTEEPKHLFRISEKMVLRIKEHHAIVRLITEKQAALD